MNGNLQYCMVGILATVGGEPFSTCCMCSLWNYYHVPTSEFWAVGLQLTYWMFCCIY